MSCPTTIFVVALSFLVGSSAATCPSSPLVGFAGYPEHCIGSDAPTCGSPIDSGNDCGDSVAECVEGAASACRKDSNCYSFAVLAGGADCNDPPPIKRKWHTYKQGNGRKLHYMCILLLLSLFLLIKTPYTSLHLNELTLTTCTNTHTITMCTGSLIQNAEWIA